MGTMANHKENNKLLQDIAELQTTIQKLKNKIDAVTRWLNSKFDILPDDIKEILSTDDLSFDEVNYENGLEKVSINERNNLPVPTEGVTVISSTDLDNLTSEDEGTANIWYNDEKGNSIKIEVAVKDEIFSDDEVENDPLGDSVTENDINSVSSVECEDDRNSKTTPIPKSMFAKSLVIQLNDIKKSGGIINEQRRTGRNTQIPKRKSYQVKINELLRKAESDNVLPVQSPISTPSFASFSKSTRVRKATQEYRKDFQEENDLMDDETWDQGTKKTFHCNVTDCGRTFLYRRSFENHVKHGHPDEDVEERSNSENDSSDSDYSTSPKRPLRRQGKRRGKGNNYECDTCEKSFPTKLGLHVHEVKSHGKGKVYHCHYNSCERTFRSKCTLLKHMRTFHPDYEGLPKQKPRGKNKRIIKCLFDGCDTIFDTRRKLNAHQKKENHFVITTESKNESIDENSSTQLNCQQCKKEFNDKLSLLSHLETHGDTFRCTFANCNQIFISTSYKSIHKTKKAHWTEMELQNGQKDENELGESEEIVNKNEKLDSNILACPKCGIKDFATRELLNEHILNSCYKCKLCKKSFALNSDRVLHSTTLCNTIKTTKAKKIMTVFEDQDLNCLFCQIEFSSHLDLVDHMTLQHSVKLFSCSHPGCKRRLKSEEEAVEHENQLHCKICYRAFVHVAYFKVHNDKEHDGKEEISLLTVKNGTRSFTPGFQCPQCGIILESLKLLKLHAERGCVKCNICGKIYTTKAGLEEHLRVHNQNKPFLCNTCGQRFNRKHTLQKHINAKHSSDKKTYKCMSCDKVFYSMVGYIKHVKVHDDGEIPRIQCTLCGFDFVSEGSLRKHTSAIHENLRPYPCHLCDKKFKTHSARKYHVQTHDNPNGRKRSLNKDVDEFHAASKRRKINK